MMEIPKARRTLALVIAIAASTIDTPAEAVGSRCTAAKYKAMGTKYQGKAKCYAKALQRDTAVDLACLQKAETKFAVKWARAEAAGDCFTIHDEAANENIVDGCINATVQSLGIAPVTTTTSPTTTTTLCTPDCAGKTCGDDGCGGSCGMCTPPAACGGGGTPNQCGCTPTNCAVQCKNCGPVDDGCGGTLNCGACTPPQTCGGGGISGVCGGATSVTTTSTSSSTVTTGSMCSLTCGVSSCPSPYACVGGSGPCHCEIPASACTSQTAPACGGPCPPPLSCRDAGGTCACLPACPTN